MDRLKTDMTPEGSKYRLPRVLRAVCIFLCVSAIVCVSASFLLTKSVEQSRGNGTEAVIVSFGASEGVMTLATALKEKGIISSEIPFVYYLLKENLRTKLQAGDYLVSGTMSISDIVKKIVRGETVEEGTKVTFPEGITAVEMASRLDANGLSGSEFLEAVRHPDASLRKTYPFLLGMPADATLEGFLFPDTYFFDPKGGTDGILTKMLDGFENRVVPALATTAEGDRYSALTLASVVEMEVRTDSDRKIVADIFNRRIAVGMPLQSDATVRYVLGETKIKHSLTDIAIDSPYNTYVNKGLPPGPISNPGMSSIVAVLNPTPNKYMYFLNNPNTGQTVFSETFEEHVANKGKNGL